MPFLKVEVSSIYSVNFRQTRYVEVDPEDLEEDGTIAHQYEDEILNDVVNDVVQAYGSLVDNEGD